MSSGEYTVCLIATVDFGGWAKYPGPLREFTAIINCEKNGQGRLYHLGENS